jgi:hypothetical protein
MAGNNASSTFPMTLDDMNYAYDPNCGPAIEAIQQYFGGYTGPAALTNVFLQSFPDEIATSTIQPASGTVELFLCNFLEGAVINNISIVTAATAAVTPTHQWAGISSYVAGSNGKCLATSADGLTAAIAADVVVSFALSAPYTVPASGLYYVYYCIAAGTVPTIAAGTTLSAHGRGNVAPIPAGPGDTGKTTPYAVNATVTAPTAAAAGTLIYLN